jgi:hypothetical protein
MTQFHKDNNTRHVIIDLDSSALDHRSHSLTTSLFLPLVRLIMLQDVHYKLEKAVPRVVWMGGPQMGFWN